MLKPKHRLSATMTLSQFDNGYWYADDLRKFAQQLNIPAAGKLRKDELEAAIKQLLSSKAVTLPPRLQHKTASPTTSDIDRGLRLDLRVVNYNGNDFTKQFIVNEARKQKPLLKEKSGVRYRLNRWREEQLAAGKKLTYGDLVRHYISLNEGHAPFARIPSGRYINFLADYSAHEKQQSRTAALAAWEQLKKLDIPKTYAAWKQHQQAER